MKWLCRRRRRRRRRLRRRRWRHCLVLNNASPTANAQLSFICRIIDFKRP